MIQRDLQELLHKRIDGKKVIIVLGARQVGKTTLLRTLVNANAPNVLWLNGDEPDVRERYSNASSTALRAAIGKQDTVVFDEAQRIFDIGLSVKIIHDQYPDLKVFVTGSSSLELHGIFKEPLTGRKWEYHLHPFSYNELVSHFGYLEEQRMLEQRMIFGSYPEVILADHGQQRQTLLQLLDSYLFKDLFSLGGIKRPTQFEKLLKAIAFQVGNEVSYTELGQMAELDNETVLRYIDLMEQSFLIFRLSALSRNLRNEIKKSRKLYFYDNGVRNALIGNFNDLANRSDVGALWENYLVCERLKLIHNTGAYGSRYFWRTHAQQEIDYIEDFDGMLHAYEFKWGTKKKAHFSRAFTNAYPNTETKVITPKNYHEFLSPDDEG